MRHVTPAGLDELDGLLDALRTVPGLVERKRGVFYRRSRAFLHFHEDPTGLHADVRFAEEFERCRVQSPAEQQALVDRVRAALDG